MYYETVLSHGFNVILDIPGTVVIRNLPTQYEVNVRQLAIRSRMSDFYYTVGLWHEI